MDLDPISQSFTETNSPVSIDRPLGDGEGGFCEMGDRVGMAMSGLGPAAFPEGLLIMTGGDSGRGVKLHANHTVDLGGGAAGPKVGGGAWGSVCCRLGTVA